MPAPIPPLIAAASRLPRVANLAKKVLGTNRTGRTGEAIVHQRNRQLINDELINRGIHRGIRTPLNELDRKLPGGFEKFSKTVLAKSRPGGLVDAARAVARSDAVGRGAGATILGGGAFALSQTDPNDLGREMARMDMTLQEGFDTVRQKASDLAQIPQAYFMQVEQAYKDERQRQQEMQNIQEFGNPMGEPVEMPPAIEEQAINPVSMAGGGPAMSDNEPRFEDRSPENQIFSIDTAIGNLMTEYDMVVRNKEFERAQMIADQIDQLQQQKIGIQAQNDPQQDDISRILDSISQ